MASINDVPFPHTAGRATATGVSCKGSCWQHYSGQFTITCMPFHRHCNLVHRLNSYVQFSALTRRRTRPESSSSWKPDLCRFTKARVSAAVLLVAGLGTNTSYLIVLRSAISTCPTPCLHRASSWAEGLCNSTKFDHIRAPLPGEGMAAGARLHADDQVRSACRTPDRRPKILSACRESPR